jgi:hypothetical protein
MTAADILGRLSGDLARPATVLRGWPANPPDWPGHSYAAALATAQARWPDLAGWLAAILATIPRPECDRLAAALAAELATTAGSGR